MKKNLFIIAAATLIASCSSNDSFKDIATTQIPIEFESYSQSATKATENNQADYNWALNNHHSTFDVWGYRTNSSTNTWVFTKQLVQYESTAWGYTPARYWDKSADSYTFYAAAPNDAKWTLADNTDANNNEKNDNYSGTYYLKYTGFSISDHDATTATINTVTGDNYTNSFNTAASGKDLMIAAPCNWTSIGTAVNLEFIHILSRLNVIIQRGEDLTDDDVLKLVEFKVSGFKSAGDFKENTTNAVNTKPGTSSRWNNVTGSIDYTSTYATSSNQLEVKYDYDNNATHEGHDKKQYVLQSIVIPQSIAYESINIKGKQTADPTQPAAQAYLYIKYSITNNNWSTENKTETFEGYYNLAAAFGAASGNINFNEGWQNNLTIRIQPNIINFEPMVSEWSNNVEYNYSMR